MHHSCSSNGFCLPQVAKVYVSIFSDPQGKAAAIDQLAKLQGCGPPCTVLYTTIVSRSLQHQCCVNSQSQVLALHCRYVRKRIGQTMSLRLTPEIRFIYDEAHDRGERVRHLMTLPARPPHALTCTAGRLCTV